MFEGVEISSGENRTKVVEEAYAKSRAAAARFIREQFPENPAFPQRIVGGIKDRLGGVLVSGIENKGTERSIREREVSLTCDDGPTGQTLEILDYLERNGAKATFFWFAEEVELLSREDPDLLRQILDSVKRTGSEIGLHGDYRAKTAGIKSRFLGEVLADKMKADKEKLEQLIGAEVKVFRFHNWHLGPLATAVGKIARNLNMIPIGLTISVGVDATASSVEQNKDIFGNITAGSMVDIHEKREEKVTSPLEIVPPLISNLSLKRFKFVTVSEILQ